MGGGKKKQEDVGGKSVLVAGQSALLPLRGRRDQHVCVELLDGKRSATHSVF